MAIIKRDTGGLVQDTVALDYEHWTTREFPLKMTVHNRLVAYRTDDILTAVLPQQVEDIPSGFTITGHIGELIILTSSF